MTFEAPQARPHLSDEVADDVRERILTGDLAAGQHLRVEHLAEMLNVSATPVREGLQIMRSEGFVELLPRRGFVVRPLTADDIRDVFRARALLSGELAYRAASALSTEDLARLENLHEATTTAFAAGDTDTADQGVRDFHRLIHDAAGAPRLRWSLDLLARFVPRNFYSRHDVGAEISGTDHSALLIALRERDAPRARSLMEQHVERSGEALAAYRADREAPPLSQP